VWLDDDEQCNSHVCTYPESDLLVFVVVAVVEVGSIDLAVDDVVFDVVV
jgi:hypothetical protein